MNYELIYEFNSHVLLPNDIIQKNHETPENYWDIQKYDFVENECF